MKSFLFLSVAAAGALFLQHESPRPVPANAKVGRMPDGSFLLNSGWTLRPTGEQVPVDTLPMSSAVSNDGKYLLVLNGGWNPPSISVIDIASKKELGRTALPDAWLGLATAPNSNKIYVGGGSRSVVHELTLNSDGSLKREREMPIRNDAEKNGAFIGDVAISPDAHLLYAADLYGDAIAVVNLQSGQIVGEWKTGRRPYRIIVAPGGKQLVVSAWGEASIYQMDANTGAQIARTRVGPHPTDIVWIRKPAPTEEGQPSTVGRIFVAAANTNNVYSFGVARDGQLSQLEAINVSMTPMQPLGMTPSALAADPEGTHLYIVCSDGNAVAAVDISGPHTQMMGFIPTGWYPTAVRILNNELAILNGKGLGSKPNPNGPNPAARTAVVGSDEGPPSVQYVAHIQTGTVQFQPIPDAQQLSAFSRTVTENSPYRDDLMYGPVTDQQQASFSKSEGHPSPIQHVIYIIKENRTYDQVLGDMKQGNGDGNLVLFGDQITPNLHELAREYVLYDNFYENADVSADGHNWASAAIAPDYTVKTWPSEYAHRKKGYDFEGGEPANSPPAGYIWDNAVSAGLSVRDYGQWAENIPLKEVNGPRQIKLVHDPLLKDRIDWNYRGFDLEYSDVDRAKEFLREWKQFEQEGQAPNLFVVRMGNDHTSGTRPGTLTPLAYAADNDYGVGLLVDGVSHSKLWPSTAIFVIEDDAQNGPDHVDSHRAPAWVISPYTHRGSVDSRMYNQMSILRTMELVLGVRPMTQFDAAARPMFASFSQQPNAAAYNVIQPKTSMTERNPPNGPGARASTRMNFEEADLIDDDELNAVLWRALKHSDPPPPTRSAFGH